MAKDAEREIEPEENPYNLSTDERTYPRGGGREWLDPIIKLQREGIEEGFPPQNLFGLPKHLKRRWISQAWKYHVSTLPPEDQQAIRSRSGPGRERHTRKRRHIDR